MSELPTPQQKVKPRFGRTWSPGECHRLRALFGEKRSIEEIAREMGRSPWATRRKLWELGFNTDGPNKAGVENQTLLCLRAVCRIYGCNRSDLIAPNRKHPWIYRRMLAAWLGRQLGASLQMAGRPLGGMHHASVMNACRWVDAKRASDPGYCELSNALLAYLRGEGDWPAHLEQPDPIPTIEAQIEVAIKRHRKRPKARLPQPETKDGEPEAPFYDAAPFDRRSRRSFLVEQNDAFCAAMRAALAAEGNQP